MLTAASLSYYLKIVSDLRKDWKVKDHKELWFRAESSTHATTRLQPGLYRPRAGSTRKTINELLTLENDLYEEFQRCAPQLSDRLIEDDWDSYFLMQHHGVPTRLLDWTDGALIALHFAVNHRTAPFTTGAVIYAMNPHWLVKLLKRHPDRKDAERRWVSFVVLQIKWRKYWHAIWRKETIVESGFHRAGDRQSRPVYC